MVAPTRISNVRTCSLIPQMRPISLKMPLSFQLLSSISNNHVHTFIKNLTPNLIHATPTSSKFVLVLQSERICCGLSRCLSRIH
jgi:hypothetical protein